jgi:hypothetical protein
MTEEEFRANPPRPGDKVWIAPLEVESVHNASVVGLDSRGYRRTYYPADIDRIVALRSALLPQPMEGWVMLPCEPDEDLIRAMNDGYRSVRRQGASGMSIDAQWRAEYGPEIAAYRALLAAIALAEQEMETDR